MKNVLKGAAALALFFILGCSEKPEILGDWVQPIPGQKDRVQGIRFENGGKLSSINMSTLAYETWERNGNKLVLSGKSIGNGVTSPFSDTYYIEKLDEQTLVLKDGDFTLTYFRR